MQLTTQQPNASTANIMNTVEPEYEFDTVLIVEDSMVERFRMQAMLQRFGYKVITADNGRQALQIIKDQPIHLILSDWRMPELSGIELCHAVRADPTIERPYMILVTGRSTKADLIVGMDAGADDFIAKPFNEEELRVRTQAGVRLLALHAETKRRGSLLFDALEREASTNKVIREDLIAAARMQRDTLPGNGCPFPQTSIATLFRAATQVGGDSYNYFRLDDRHLAFYLLDVVGHGIASAMLSFTVSHFLSPDTGAISLTNSGQPNVQDAHRALPASITAPHQVVASLNQHFLDKSEDCKQYFTIIYGVLDVQTGLGELCQAGHPHPFIIGDDQSIRSLGDGGLPVGLIADATHESVAFHLGNKERLILHSDGVTECRDKDDVQFGARRLQHLLGRFHDKPLAEGVSLLEECLLRWQGHEDHVDDVSLIALSRQTDPRLNAESL